MKTAKITIEIEVPDDISANNVRNFIAEEIQCINYADCDLTREKRAAISSALEDDGECWIEVGIN